MKHQITTSIEINASKEKVWNAFFNFDDYPKWNPFIKSIKGEIALNKKFKAEIGDMKFSPTVKVLDPQKEFTWLGSLIIPDIFDGRHSFLFIENENGTTTLIQKENFNGILVPLLKSKLNTEILDGFNNMNKKLKELVENGKG